MTNDPFDALKATSLPQPSQAAKARALKLSLAAFDQAQAEAFHTPQAAKPAGWRGFLAGLRGSWGPNVRIPIGTVAAALLLMPLGYQLYTSTAISPVGEVVMQRAPASPAMPVAPASPPAPAEAEAPPPAADALTQAETAMAPAPMAPSVMAPQRMMAPAGAASRMQTMARPAAPSTMLAQPSGDSFTAFDEQRLKVAAQDPVSTFSVDVDTASYAYVRRTLEQGNLPNPDAVRIEEMLNYFPYDYAAPTSAQEPFATTIAVYPTPWNAQTQILQIGIKGFTPSQAEPRANNLTFLIDTSGSMDEADKLPLLKRAFGLLVEQLDADDTVSIVTYAGSAGAVLEPTSGAQKAKILAALDQLAAGGGTAGSQGIELAYRLNAEAQSQGSNNRVILATDGDFNIGIAEPRALEDFIRTRRDRGIALSVLGFGQGNLDDATMQALAQTGNGNAAYIDSLSEARKVLVEEAGATLQTIAQDVKIQVEFNPARVAEYRLIGYETRALNREDFNNDRVDAGDVGAGHTVTALYEITPVGSGAALVEPLRYGPAAQPADATGDELAFVRLRYKLPGQDQSSLLAVPVGTDDVVADFADAAPDFRFAAAVAAFGQKLRGSVYGGELDYPAIASIAQAARGEDASGYRSEFISLVRLAESLSPARPDGSDPLCSAPSEATCP